MLIMQVKMQWTLSGANSIIFKLLIDSIFKLNATISIKLIKHQIKPL